MAEYIREIKATIEIDTNKRTIMRKIKAGTLDDLETELLGEIMQLQEDLGPWMTHRGAR